VGRGDDNVTKGVECDNGPREGLCVRHILSSTVFSFFLGVIFCLLFPRCSDSILE
jgi:hypothetical protein